MQQYFLLIAYLMVSALLFLGDSYRKELSFVIRIKGMLMENRRYLDVFFISGVIIALLSLFFPVYPGPVILGDIIPSVWAFYAAFFFRFRFSEKRSELGEAFFEASTQKRTERLGWITLAIALSHFLLPELVLI